MNSHRSGSDGSTINRMNLNQSPGVVGQHTSASFFASRNASAAHTMGHLASKQFNPSMLSAGQNPSQAHLLITTAAAAGGGP